MCALIQVALIAAPCNPMMPILTLIWLVAVVDVLNSCILLLLAVILVWTFAPQIPLCGVSY